MLKSDERWGALLVYAMYWLSVAYVPWEIFGPLPFHSLLLETGEDLELFWGISFKGLSFFALTAAVSTIQYLLLPILRETGDGAVVSKKHRWRITLSAGIAFSVTLIPLAFLHFVLLPERSPGSLWLFCADCVVQGRFWWGMLLVFFNQLYFGAYMQKFNPDQDIV